jgi:hypothetical protein
MRKAQVVSKRDAAVGQPAALAQLGQLGLGAVEERRVGAVARAVLHQPGAVDDAGQPPGDGADHPGHRRQQEHRAPRRAGCRG